MLSSCSLDGVWKVRGFDGQHGWPHHYCADEADERTFIDARVPGDIHLDLERAGWIQDCNVGLNSLNARWIEEHIWIYRTHFTVPRESLSQHTWLVFEGLDLNARIFLNGEEAASHANAFLPCRIDVTGKLREGENTLAVHIESGLYSVSEKPGKGLNPAIDHALHKRAWLRKPQYSFSWDWNPRLVNVGIWKSVRLEWTDTVRLDALTVYPELSNDHTNADIVARVFVDNVLDAGTKAVIRVKVPETGAVVEKEVELSAGLSDHQVSVSIKNPKLWWPRPHGDQPLYMVECEVLVNGKVVDKSSRRTGIRSIRINQNKHPETGKYFILEVNGRKIFAKGGNWVPADMIYSRVDSDHYRKLVELAVDANFNALRIWGGGLYADHALLDACDEMGVLVWHDFIFACSKYPGTDAEFLNNVRREITYQVRDLSPHPSLLVWCGNNELEWGAWEWGYDRENAHPDYALYHLEIPRIIKREDPSRPYWPSSPFSPDSVNPKDSTCGDQHPWHVSLGVSGANFWDYRKDVARFPNEGGVLGASSPATLRQFMPEDQWYLHSPVWEYHDNACNFWTTRGICYQYVEHWLGMNPEEMDFDDYIFYSAILQSEGLQEYINNYRRRMFSSSSAIFWMYNDSWPASHGWTIVDYYLRKKLAYHPVRRANAPVYVVPVAGDDKVVVYGINDTPETWEGEVRYGIFGLGGGLPVDETKSAKLAPNASTVIAEIPRAKWEEAGIENSGAFAVLMKDGKAMAQNRVFVSAYRDLKWAKPQISVTRREGKAIFSSPTFVWAACLDIDGEVEISDNVFDLIPGIEYEIDWPEGKPLPAILRCASTIPA